MCCQMTSEEPFPKKCISPSMSSFQSNFEIYFSVPYAIDLSLGTFKNMQQLGFPVNFPKRLNLFLPHQTLSMENWLSDTSRIYLTENVWCKEKSRVWYLGGFAILLYVQRPITCNLSRKRKRKKRGTLQRARKEKRVSCSSCRIYQGQTGFLMWSDPALSSAPVLVLANDYTECFASALALT